MTYVIEESDEESDEDDEDGIEVDEDQDGIFDDYDDEYVEESEDQDEDVEPIENLLALRDDLIQEIRGHMHHTNHAWQNENLTYDLAEGHHIMLEGSMNRAIPENVTYELAEGHHAKLAGSMNNTPSANHLLSLHQGVNQEAAPDMGSQQLDTNVMYDPVSGEGLVCVNGRCISNKRKFQMHHEDQIGLHANRRRRKGRQQRGMGRGRGRGRGAGSRALRR